MSNSQHAPDHTQYAIRGRRSHLVTTATEHLRQKYLPLSRQTRRRLLTVTLLVSDALMLELAFYLAYFLRFEALPYYAPITPRRYALLALGIVPFWLLIFIFFQLYNRQYLLGGLHEYVRTFNAVSMGTMSLVFIGFFHRDGMIISRGWLILSWFFAFVFVSGARFAVRRLVYTLRRRRHFLSPSIIVGANEEGRALAEQLQRWASSGLNVTGFVDARQPVGSLVVNSYRVLGNLDDLERLVEDSDIEELIVASTALSREQLLGVFRAFGANSQVNLRLSSGLFEVMTTGLQVQELAYVPLITLDKARITGLDATLKRGLDYALTIPGLILTSPLLALIALAIKLDSPGSVIHRRRVMGVGGREFDALKFRTMVVNNHEILTTRPELRARLEEDHKLKDDPRVTRAGKLLRRYSLDELPQLLNVLRGQMSLVGPRMISPAEMGEYGKWAMNLLTVKPGITGLWQISGRADISYEERVRLDMHYIRNWTIWLDLQLLIRTIPAVLQGKGAY